MTRPCRDFTVIEAENSAPHYASRDDALRDAVPLLARLIRAGEQRRQQSQVTSESTTVLEKAGVNA